MFHNNVSEFEVRVFKAHMRARGADSTCIGEGSGCSVKHYESVRWARCVLAVSVRKMQCKRTIEGRSAEFASICPCRVLLIVSVRWQAINYAHRVGSRMQAHCAVRVATCCTRGDLPCCQSM